MLDGLAEPAADALGAGVVDAAVTGTADAPALDGYVIGTSGVRNTVHMSHAASSSTASAHQTQHHSSEQN